MHQRYLFICLSQLPKCSRQVFLLLVIKFHLTKVYSLIRISLRKLVILWMNQQHIFPIAARRVIPFIDSDEVSQIQRDFEDKG